MSSLDSYSLTEFEHEPWTRPIGMCFTGGFALAMMTDPAVVAPVLSQPSLPLCMGPGGARRARSIDISPADLAAAKTRLESEDLTVHLDDSDPEGPTRQVERRVIEFFSQRTGSAVTGT